MAQNKLWDRPKNSGAPCRPGDRIDTPLFVALGRAVSAWEGVQAATASLFCSFLDADDCEVKREKFGKISRVPDRAKALTRVGQEFLSRDVLSKQQAGIISPELSDLMAAYEGWAQRRNDLAHGYVTAAQSPNYNDEQQRLITTYSLLPSHARSEKWIFAQPLFNYTASEIETFAQEFEALDDRLELLASKVAQPFAALRAIPPRSALEQRVASRCWPCP